MGLAILSLRLPSSAPCAGADPQNPQDPNPGEIFAHTSVSGPYHAVLVLLRSIVHSRVPSIGTSGIYFAGIQFPVPRKMRRDPLASLLQLYNFLFFPSGRCLKDLEESATSGVHGAELFKTSLGCTGQQKLMRSTLKRQTADLRGTDKTLSCFHIP